MTEHLCTFANQRGEALAGYLYDDLPADERAAFDRHLASCALCRSELDLLRGVRLDLASWTPPEPASLTLSPTLSPEPSAAASTGWKARLNAWPVWAQAAAAALVVGVALGAANFRVSYADGGITVRTGWLTPPPAALANAPAAPVGEAPAPWQSDIAALEQALRGEIEARRVALAASSPSSPAGVPAATGTAPAPVPTQGVVSAPDNDLVRRVRALIRESEQRQQRELALRIAELAREVQNQRQADLVRIDRSLGVMQNQTGMEVMRTQRQLNSLAQQVSQRP